MATPELDTYKDTLEQQQIREKRANQDAVRENVRTLSDLKGFEIFTLLLSFFFGGNDDIDNNALDEISSNLGIDNNAFRDITQRFRSGESNAFESARDARRLANVERADIDAARESIAHHTGDALLEVIASKESGGNYNAYYGHANATHLTFEGQQRVPTTMSVNEVLEWGENRDFSAFGKYQIINKTLAGLKKSMGLTGDEPMDEAMQDRMAYALLEGRGYDDYLAGEIDDATFMENLSKEWAALPRDGSGLSYYDGDGVNKAHVPPATILAAMRMTREEQTNPNSTIVPRQHQVLASAEVTNNNGGIHIIPPMGEDRHVTSDFGPRSVSFSRMHHGIDYRTKDLATDGEVDLHARQPMTILAMGHEAGFGNRLVVALGEDDKGRPITAQYAHLDRLPTHLSPGDVVTPGSYIATTGSTGKITGAHLDYQVRVGSQTVDPQLAFQTDLSDSRNGDRLIANAQQVLGRKSYSGTYNAIIAPALAKADVQQGLTELEQVTGGNRTVLLASAAPETAPRPRARPEKLTAAFGNGEGTTTEDPAQPNPLTVTFGNGEGTDQITQTENVPPTNPSDPAPTDNSVKV